MRLAGFCLFVAVCVSILDGQTPAGEIRIAVEDPSGMALQANGKLTPPNGTAQTFETDAQGNYTFSNLPPGRYRVQIEKQGFAPQSVTVNVAAGAPATRTFMMALAAISSSVDVVAATPLPGTDLPLEDIPAPVQTASARDLQQSGSLDLADLMNQRLSGVYVNQNQENPFQPDVNYRGYEASPLLGTPEGLSVYMDGVRQNQPFGDIVAWDLIPKIAIAEMALMPGSNPLFGLNTLGGAISVQTKSGLTESGGTLSVSGGSFGRREGEAEYGGSSQKTGFNWYVAGNLFREDGWRQDSPSEVRQSFARLGWQHGNTTIGLTFSYADNWLTGNGSQDFRALERDYSSVYSVPDFTWNRSPAFNLILQHQFSNGLTLSGNAYFRYIRADSTNGNVNTNALGNNLYTLAPGDVAALQAAGYSGFPSTGSPATQPYPYWSCFAQVLEVNSPDSACTGVITNGYTYQHNYGVSGQFSWVAKHNHIIIGSAWDRSDVKFQQYTQYGYIASNGLNILPLPSYEDGSTADQNGVPIDTRVDLRGTVNTASVFAADTLNIGKWAITVSGRYNRTPVDNTDLLPPAPAGIRGNLNGQYVFQRFNPSAGFTYALPKMTSVYLNYSEASRAPTTIELGCADPNNPCNLPNALVSDPPLKQVVTRTIETGVRGSIENNLRWSFGWFGGQNYNDILFVASPQTGFGYFANFGETRRDGLETSLSGHIGRMMLGGNYTFLNAIYQTTQVIDGAFNSSNSSSLAGFPGEDGNITITPGDRIPQVPRNMIKAYLEYEPTSKSSVDLDFIAVGRSFARGNENNLDQPDGVHYLGQGLSPGYGVLNLGAHYQLLRNLELFAQIDNLLNHHYFTGAALGATPYTNQGVFNPQPLPPNSDGNYPSLSTTYLAPGAPIGVWGGIRFKF